MKKTKIKKVMSDVRIIRNANHLKGTPWYKLGKKIAYLQE
jgi:hypothetical protein